MGALGSERFSGRQEGQLMSCLGKSKIISKAAKGENELQTFTHLTTEADIV